MMQMSNVVKKKKKKRGIWGTALVLTGHLAFSLKYEQVFSILLYTDYMKLFSFI